MQRHIALHFDAPATADDKDAGAKFAGVGYSGGLIPSWNAVIDLASTRVEPSMPVLLAHDKGAVIGVVEAADNDGARLALAGAIHSDIDAAACDVVRKSRRGNRYQMSVGLYNAIEKIIPAGKRESVNGREFAGPVLVLMNGLVREVSVVALGADPNTEARFFSEGHSFSHPGATTMPATLEELSRQVADLTAQNATLTAQNATLTAQNATLTAQNADLTREAEAARNASAAAATAARTAAIATLAKDVGREFSDATRAVYLAMSAEQFDAIAADLRELAKVKRPPGLMSHQAAEGDQQASGSGKSILVEQAEARAREFAERQARR